MFTTKLAKKPIAKKIESIAYDFIKSMQSENYDHIWNDLITDESADLLSTVLWPMHMYQAGKVNELFVPIQGGFGQIDVAEGFKLAFELDLEGMRSAFFSGFANGFQGSSWKPGSTEFPVVFVADDSALCLVDGKVPFIPFMIGTDDTYKVDMESMVVFSVSVSPKILYLIGQIGLGLGHFGTALAYYELATSFNRPLQRIRKLLLNNSVFSQYVTDKRKQELLEFENDIVLARDSALRLLSGPKVESASKADTYQLMCSIFKGYSQIPECLLSELELALLYAMDDAKLRRAVSATLKGFDPIVIEREATKPHGPAEFADMELPLTIAGELYFFCLPFKSGVEIRGASVPVEIAYQVIRPFIYFPRCFVVLITAKPCSQYLSNYIKVARATQGWLIEVIQAQELGKLLKLNGLLR